MAITAGHDSQYGQFFQARPQILFTMRNLILSSIRNLITNALNSRENLNHLFCSQSIFDPYPVGYLDSTLQVSPPHDPYPASSFSS